MQFNDVPKATRCESPQKELSHYPDWVLPQEEEGAGGPPSASQGRRPAALLGPGRTLELRRRRRAALKWASRCSSSSSSGGGGGGGGRCNFTLAELGVCEPNAPPHPAAAAAITAAGAVPYCPDLRLLQRGYSLSAGSDADSEEPEGPLSPERAIQLWSAQGGCGCGGGGGAAGRRRRRRRGGGGGGGGGGASKSRRSSGVSSHENSALTLTDSENDNNKSDDESASGAELLPISGGAGDVGRGPPQPSRVSGP
ncbi:hypothetical protein CRUP_018448, partial [Coryphaenoides rupestris]